MSTIEEFTEADRENTAAERAWGEHVDQCELCRRSVFACLEGLRLSAVANAAWCRAKRLWDGMSPEEKTIVNG